MTAKTGRVGGRRVLVTGASSGIGLATARLLAAEGASVALHYNRHERPAREAAESIARAGGHAIALGADLLDRASRAALVSRAVEALGGLDVLVNNAGGVIGTRSLLEVTESDWERTFGLNVEAPFFLAQQAFCHMRHAGGGRIVNLSSIGVKYGGSPTTLHYAAAKSALETVTAGLAKAGAAYAILVNAVRPGFIDTPFHADLAPEVVEQRVRLIPMQRAGQASEVAELILFLVSDAAAYVTGQTFAVSGGD